MHYIFHFTGFTSTQSINRKNHVIRKSPTREKNENQNIIPYKLIPGEVVFHLSQFYRIFIINVGISTRISFLEMFFWFLLFIRWMKIDIKSNEPQIYKTHWKSPFFLPLRYQVYSFEKNLLLIMHFAIKCEKILKHPKFHRCK